MPQYQREGEGLWGNKSEKLWNSNSDSRSAPPVDFALKFAQVPKEVRYLIARMMGV